MAFPPEFSSTATYANRYDLDEINVFLEGDYSNPMFFKVEGLNKIFAFGKHYFTISLLPTLNQEYQLKEYSKILFELKSINNVVLVSDVVKINEKNGLITCYFEILRDPKRTYKEIEDGDGTLIIAASLVNKSTTREENLIPNAYRDAINYRCVYPINIRKNALNANSPILTNVNHVYSTIKGRFSFVKANIPTKKGSTAGTTYDSNGKPNNTRPRGTSGVSD